jgi:endonuclease/exonuclease/phosphatase family metal-dependent hydrolase
VRSNPPRSRPEVIDATDWSPTSEVTPAVDVYALGDGLPDGTVSFIDDAKADENRLIDYAFVEKSLAGRVGKVRIDGEAKGSDHLPLWFELD